MHALTARPRATLLAVLVLALLASVLGTPVAGELRSSGGFTAADAGSARAVDRIEAVTGQSAAAAVVLLLRTPAGAAAPAARARRAQLAGELGATPGVARVIAGRELVARDGRSAFVAATVDASASDDELLAGLEDRFGDVPDVVLGGTFVANEQVGARVGEDLGRAELIAAPILLLLSLLFFRGARAALIPLVVGVLTVLATFVVLRLVNGAVYGLTVFALNLVVGLGLGLAIDYALFLLTRYREELEEHGAGPEALRRTMATAGRTVAFSAATVAIALATLVVFPLAFLKSMGVAGAVVAVLAGAVSLAVVPVLFALWGPKLAVRPRRREGGWYRLAHAVMRRPGTVTLATGLVMLAAAAPALRAQFTPIDATVIPREESSRVVADALARDVPGEGTQPVLVVVDAPRDATSTYARALAALPGVRAVAPPRALDARTTQLDVIPEGAPEGAAARRLVRDVRAVAAPAEALVGGAAAEFVDQQAAISSRLLPAGALLVALTSVVLWLMTGSVILPLKAIVMNVLTVASTLGVLTLVFQDGRFTGLLGYTPNGGVEPTDFLVTAALVFALSTDYGVFLLGRIKEARGPGRTEREAVAVGLERTGAVVTAAAILLAVAIGAFTTSSISFIQQIGLGAAAGVLIDAFLVRALLVPALMALLGPWNWWSPRWLARLHDRLGADG